jgi:succinate dehydrogenase / fumarate reductase flavoprotein subunit
VDYNLMSNVSGLFVLGEANFSDHGANRLGASALMQGLADGYFIIPYTMGNYLASNKQTAVATDAPEFRQAEAEVRDRISKLLAIKGKLPTAYYHRKLGKMMWDNVGMARSEESLKKALAEIAGIRDEFWRNVNVTGGSQGLNPALEEAGRVADFLEFAELLTHDALDRDESCGAHFRVEHQEEGEAKRDDEKYMFVSAWEHKGVGQRPERHAEPLVFETVHPSTRSYK